ncbi:MAG: UDP-N-acetylglucosamine 2-epimerase (non-hydrolyzing) [Myxococcales bacterium]|nr:UDP-N-acetylglucosamine 2-epimerase (non-hydrolyzing) [Myxococcales bacterium]
MPSSSPRIAILFGTRPEAIKLAPVLRAAAAFGDWQVEAWSSGQHRELLAGIVDDLELEIDVAFESMRPGAGLAGLTSRLLDHLDPLLCGHQPTWLIVQGDTTTAMIGALAGFYRGVQVAHVEAGLRTHDLAAPFPEEANRQIVARIAALHLAPTPGAAAALRAEGIDPAAIEVTGNTVVDAIRWMVGRLPADGGPPAGSGALARFAGDRRLVLVTGHRRESFGGGLEAICDGLGELARRWPEVDFVYPVHLNPAVQEAVHRRLGGLDNVHLIAPVGYAAAIWLLRRSTLVITDSGGLQEEAPELGKPTLVTREATERPEARERGYALLVGYDAARLVAEASRWLGDPAAWAAASAGPGRNPFGDGRAAERVVAAIRRRLGLPVDEVPPWP